jgi:AcrR family transcriptional regulator
MNKTISRRERKKQDIKEEIFKTAVYFFRTKGFDETNIEEITEYLDISRASFFNYFSSKNQILHEMANRTVRNYKKILEKKLSGDADTAETLNSLVEELVDSMKGYKKLFRSVFLEVMRSQIGFIEADNTSGQSTVHDLMARIIIRGQERGELNEGNPYLLAEMFTGSFFNILLNWFHAPEEYTVKERLKVSVEVFLRGIKLRDQSKKAEIKSKSRSSVK